VQTNGVANTNLIWHAGRLLALEEGHAPIEIEPRSLETLGTWTFGGRLPDNMTAHPKIDPETGEMVFFANFPRRDLSGSIEIYTADRTGTLTRQQCIKGPFPALVHDFALTRDFIIFFVCPLTVSIERARSGGAAIAWEPEKQTWLGILPRQSETTDAHWLPTPASMVWHAMNACNHDEAIYIDVCQQDAAAFPSSAGEIPAQGHVQQFLTRWRVDRPTGKDVTIERLSNLVCEYPRIDPRRSGLAYRYGYVACHGGPGTGDLFHRAIGRFDHTTRQWDIHHAGNRCAVSEPIFVPKNAQPEEGHGYLLAVIFDEPRNASHLAIFNAQSLEKGPVARAMLDHRVPLGFHGLWRPNPAIAEP
jgi:carotenoid cleavage dioxygenase